MSDDEFSLWKSVADQIPRPPKKRTWGGFATALGAAAIASPIVGAAAVAREISKVQPYGTDADRRLASLSGDGNALYAEAQRIAASLSFPDLDSFMVSVFRALAAGLREHDLNPPAPPIARAFMCMIHELYDLPDTAVPPAMPSTVLVHAIDGARWRDAMRFYILRFSDPERLLALTEGSLVESLFGFARTLPPIARTTWDGLYAALGEDSDDSSLTIPLIDALGDPGQRITDLILPFFASDNIQLGLFAGLRNQVDRNHQEVSEGSKELILPHELDGTPEEAVDGFLKGTPLHQLFSAAIPFNMPARIRCEHTHVVGGTGHGKTQLLQHLIFNDLSSPEPPALVIIDSQNQMLRKLERLALFDPDGGKLADRLVIINPEDDFPPALNMFDTRSTRIEGYSRIHRETIEADTIQLFNYIFGAIAAELTQKQGTAFAYVTRLVLSISGATVDTLLQLMEDGAGTLTASPFAGQIAQLDRRAQAFFENQFFNKSAFGQTKQQIARRLYGVLQVPAFSRMFSAQENRLDFFSCIQGRKTVLVNTSKSLLKDASALFGRFIIARVLAAAFERVAIPESEHTAAYLIIDEAQEYLDHQFEDLLTQARKYNLGVLFAHQTLKQLDDLQAIVASNTSIKLAGGVSDRDARTLAPDMRTDANFIMSMQKQNRSTEFACHVRNMTSKAVRLRVPFGTLEDAPQMSAAQHARLVATNTARYAARHDEASEAPAASSGERPAPTRTGSRTDPDSGDHTEASSKW
jgi:hypothetical protein